MSAVELHRRMSVICLESLADLGSVTVCHMCKSVVCLVSGLASEVDLVSLTGLLSVAEPCRG